MSNDKTQNLKTNNHENPKTRKSQISFIDSIGLIGSIGSKEPQRIKPIGQVKQFYTHSATSFCRSPITVYRLLITSLFGTLGFWILFYIWILSFELFFNIHFPSQITRMA